MFTLKNNFKLIPFVLLISTFNFLFFHIPFFQFVFETIDYKSLNGIFVIASLMVLMLVLNAFVFSLLLTLSQKIGKFLLILFFLINAVAVYFVATYGVIIDESMIGNIFNTNYDESSSYFSFKLIIYLVLLGILPSYIIVKSKIEKIAFKKFSILSGFTLLFALVLVFVNATNWLWIDKNSKKLGGLAMPWSYVVNTSLFYIHEYKKNEKEILLPDAKIKDAEKAIVVLVIGESARRQNFSLYNYDKNTNPLLSLTPDVFHFDANSSATYTTAGVKSILDHKETSDLYEILPNYLYRNDVDVFWRTTNWGEPPVHIKNYQDRAYLQSIANEEDKNYDAVLLSGLKEQILASKKNKILVVLHTSTSHGPSYNTKYPSQFEHFKPVCKSVELSYCSQNELINAYDNTIVYTDYLLHRTIEELKQLKSYKSTMLFVSDHGESLGEKNLYMHGIPRSIAPKEQYEIPFIVWLPEDSSKKIKKIDLLSQYHVFHSVLNFLHIDSPIYNEEMNIFE